MIQNYTLSDFITETQYRLNEPAAGALWTLADLTLYINRALFRLGLDTRLVRKDASIPVVAGLAFYGYPSDYMIPEFLYCSATLGNQRLFPTTLGQIDKRMQGRSPWEEDFPSQQSYFIPYSYNLFILWPAPAASDTINLHYIPFPATLVNLTDTTLFPLSAQKLVPVFAAYLAELKNDAKRAVMHRTEYKKRVEFVRVQQRHNAQLRPAIMAPGREFDRKHANPEVIRDYTRWGYR
jgi:hypothetical protein